MRRNQLEIIASQVVDSAFKVHTALGPELLESAYQNCLAFELSRRGIQVHREHLLPLEYDGFRVEQGYRIDLLVENSVNVENKSVEQLPPIHQAQLLTYLKLSGLKLGFLINWNVKWLKHGLRRMVLALEDESSPQSPRRNRQANPLGDWKP